MVIASLNAFRGQPHRAVLARQVKQVAALIFIPVPAFNQDAAAAVRGQFASGAFNILPVLEGLSGQGHGLRQVGGHHLGQRHQIGFDGINGVILQQLISALGHHNRIEHDFGGAVSFEGCGHRCNQLGRI